MRAIRNALSLLLALILCLGAMGGTALAEVYDEGSVGETGEWEEELPALPFPDVSAQADYAEAVAALYELGIMTGDGAGNFNPESTITRAEVAAILCRLLGVEEEAKQLESAPFDDANGFWATGYIAKASELGIINGNGRGSFLPMEDVSYEQMIKMLVCALERDSEAQAAGGWPNGYIKVAEEIGVTYDVDFIATDAATRWAVAKLVYNCVNSIG